MANPSLDSFLDNLKVEITSKLATTQSLLDKLDTSTWDAKDLEVFDTLVAEKRQTEKDHHKMTFGISRAGRQVTPADLKAATANWRYDTETAGYIFVGNGSCALERSAGKQCHHKICKEAKSEEGLSYLEYDTIIHYSQRIANAKSSRMRSALQKQRDIQLAKDREACEEWKEKAVKKFKYLGKDACEALIAMAQQLDRALTLPLVAPPERPDTVIEQIGCALSRLRQKALTTESSRFINTASLLLGALNNDVQRSQCWRDHSSHFEYFKDIEVAHVEGAVMNIRDVLALNHIVTYEFDYRLRAFLEELRDLMAILDRSIRTKLGLTVQAAFIELLKEMKNEEKNDTKPRKIWPEGHLYYALRQCLIIDGVVLEKMSKVCNATPVLTGKKFSAALERARMEPIAKSPFPSISRENSARHYHRCQQRALIHHIIDALTEANKQDCEKGRSQKLQLHARLVELFKHKISNEGFTRYKADSRRLGEALMAFKTNPEYNEVIQVIDEAQKATLSLLEEAKNKEQIEKENLDSNLENVKFRLQSPSFMVEELPGVKREDSVAIILEYASASYKDESLHTVVKPFLSRGASEFFLAFQTVGINDRSFPDASYVDENSIQNLAENLGPHMETFTRDGRGFEDFLRNRYSEGWCIAKMMVRFTLVLSQLSAHNPLTAKCVLRDMARLLENGTLSLPASWLPCFRIIVQGILHTYGYLVLEATRVFGRADVDQFVLSCIWILLLHALISPSPLDGVKQFVRAWQFIQKVFNIREDYTWTKHVKDAFEEIIDFSEIRCTNPAECGSAVEKLQEQFTASAYRVECISIALNRPNYSSHGALLSDIVDSEDFDELAAARVLKYIACRLNNTDPVLLDQDLYYLWYAFVKAESKISQGQIHPHTVAGAPSIHPAMHHGCDVRELFASHEKACGFAAGYRLGYRAQSDVEMVLDSLVYYAFSYGSRLRATKKVQKYLVPLIYPGPLFDAFKKRIQELEVLFAETTNGNTTKSLEAQIYLNRLDHLLVTGASAQDAEYLNVLQQYCKTTFGDDALVTQQVLSILCDLASGSPVSKEDTRFDVVARIWDGPGVEHIDVIYSDDETDVDSDSDDVHEPLVLRVPIGAVVEEESDSEASEEDLELGGQSVSDSADEKTAPPTANLRPISELAEPVLSTVNATAHTKRRSAIVIETPEAISRGRDPTANFQSIRNIRERSPTPFPRLPSNLKTFDNPESIPHDSSTKCKHAAPATKLDESDIPELLVDISDDESDLEHFLPFEIPEEGKVPVFCSLLSPNSMLLDRMQALQTLALHIKISICYHDHPLRAMLTSEDEEEKGRTQAMFDQLYHLEIQVRDFQERLGVYEWMQEREGKARMAASWPASKNQGSLSDESDSSYDESVPLDYIPDKDVSPTEGSGDDVPLDRGL